MNPSYPTTTATLIVRDEAHFLPGCLASLQGRLDRIIVVDTGSSDETVRIAEEHGAEILHHVWQGDFAAARNQGLEAARSDWILYIDADERLVLPDDGPLGRWIDPNAVAGLVRFSPRVGYTRYREWRLFRRDERIRFAGTFHETVIPAIRAYSAATGRAIVPTEVCIDHLGYETHSPAKLARNLAMLTDLVARDPGRAYCWHHLAETHLALGQRDAALTAAERGLLAASAGDTEDQRAAASLIRQLIARDAVAMGRPVSSFLQDALRQFPEDHALRLMLGQAHLDQGDYRAALTLALQLADVDPDGLYGARLAFDRRVFGEGALELASAALDGLGDRQGAASCIALVARKAEMNGAIRARIAALVDVGDA